MVLEKMSKKEAFFFFQNYPFYFYDLFSIVYLFHMHYKMEMVAYEYHMDKDDFSDYNMVEQ